MYKKFENLLKQHDTTIYRVAKETGIPNATLYEWSQNKYTPKVDKLMILANYFDVPIDYFLED